MNNELKHYGVLGMKWGVRRYQNKDGTLNSAGRKRYKATSSDSSTTKKVKKDLANLTEREFRKKYSTVKKTYMKRVDRYGDPYMNAPLAKIGKFVQKEARKNANKYMKKAIPKEVAQKQKLQKKANELRSKYANAKAEMKKDLANLSDSEFKNKYSTTKKTFKSSNSNLDKKVKVEIKDNKILITDGSDKWVVY